MDSTLHANRAAAMRLFALAPWPILDSLTQQHATRDFQVLRAPAVGLVMLRGRMGATGNPFNVGEATVTRCSLQLQSGTEGHAYVMGRNADHAKRAALCDALYQEDAATMMPVLAAIDQHLQVGRQATAAKAAATKVDFFTLVRGDV
jgi:alpha-D-ribose 1-methylphosphonate 5-triphosphate synthase subunit PhnG